jgi:hypothetical protein
LLETVEPAVARIATLRPACDVEVSIVFKGWRGNPQFSGFHSKRMSRGGSPRSAPVSTCTRSAR